MSAAASPVAASPGRADRIALAACLAAALALRLWNLGAPDLWSDEVHTYDAMGLPAGDLVGERLRAGHLPLWFLLMKAWTGMVGVSQFALRLPSALLGTALLLPAFGLFRRLLPAAQARWALAVLAVHPTFVELSREARMYPLLGLAFLVLAEGAVAALDEGRVPLRFWVAAAVGPFVHATWGLAVLPLAAFVWIETLRAPFVPSGLGPTSSGMVLARARSGAPRSGPAPTAATCHDDGVAEGDVKPPSPPDRPHAGRAAAAGMLASLVVLGALLLAVTPQTQALARRPWPAEAFVFVARLMTGSALSGWLRVFAGAALVGWACCLAVALHRCRGRVLRFVLWNVLGTQAAVLLAGVLGGFPVGPVRYHHFAAIGLCAAAATALGWSREQADSVEREVARRTEPSILGVRNSLDRQWSGGVYVLVLANPIMLVLLLAGLDAFRALSPRTPWSSALRRVTRLVPPERPIWVDDAGARVVGELYWRRPLTVGAPDGPDRWWHAGIDPRDARRVFLREEWGRETPAEETGPGEGDVTPR